MQKNGSVNLHKPCNLDILLFQKIYDTDLFFSPFLQSLLLKELL